MNAALWEKVITPVGVTIFSSRDQSPGNIIAVFPCGRFYRSTPDEANALADAVMKSAREKEAGASK